MMMANDEPQLRLDAASFDLLTPRDQGLSLLALLAMDQMGLTLEDLREDIQVEREREKHGW